MSVFNYDQLSIFNYDSIANSHETARDGREGRPSSGPLTHPRADSTMAAFLEGILAKCMLAFGRWCLLGIYPEEILSRFQGRIINGVHHRTILKRETSPSRPREGRRRRHVARHAGDPRRAGASGGSAAHDHGKDIQDKGAIGALACDPPLPPPGWRRRAGARRPPSADTARAPETGRPTDPGGSRLYAARGAGITRAVHSPSAPGAFPGAPSARGRGGAPGPPPRPAGGRALAGRGSGRAARLPRNSAVPFP